MPSSIWYRGLHLFISYNIFSTNIYDRRNDLDFEIVNFPFLDGDVSCSTSYGVYFSQLIRFSRASSHVADFNTCNKLLTQTLLKRGYRYHKLHITYSEFYSRYWFDTQLDSMSDLRCHGVVCSLWLWYFLIILTYYFWISLRRQSFMTT